MPVTPEVARMRKTINIARHSFANILAPITLTLVCVAGLNAAAAYGQGIITTVAGNGTRGAPGDGVSATGSALNLREFTGGVAVDAAGNLYIADSNNHRIRKVYPNGTISTVAAALNYPSGLAVDSAGNLYIVDNGNQRIRKVSPDGIITTVAGNGVAGFSGDGGPAASASLHFNRYTGNCAVDKAGNLYIPDTENHSIRKVGTDGIITTVASVFWPYSVSVDAAGAFYIGGEDGFIVKVDVAGTRTVVASGLNVPSGVAIDGAGNLYIADSHSHRIRKVEPNGVTSVIAGSGDPIFDPIEGYYFVGGFSGDGGPATSALLDFPWGVAVDATGNVFIADSLNNRVRKVTAENTQTGLSGTWTGQGRGVRICDSNTSFLGTDPYPSAITASGLAGTVGKITVSLIDFGTTFPPDTSILLVGPHGQSLILMSGVRPGNSATGHYNNLMLTFDDSAPSPLISLASGTYKPSSHGVSTFFPPAPPTASGTSLSVFDGTDPNGEWKLYGVDTVDNDFFEENCTALGGWTLTITTTPALPNQIDDAQFFVRQHYRDFLNREPDADGLAFWTNEISSCGGDAQCIELKRINVSAAFYLSNEFQQSGYFVYRFYKASFGNLPNSPVPINLSEFLPDAQQIGQGVVVGQGGWETVLENNKQTFVSQFVQRSRFASAYPTSLSPAQFVDALFANAGVVPSTSDRATAINEFGAASTTSEVVARARALRRVAENSILAQQEFNRAFVLMQYFGYLRRNPNDAPDANFDGYDFWLNKLNQFDGNFVSAEMVKAFIQSTEYRNRFAPK